MSRSVDYRIGEATLADVPLLFEARHNMYVDLGDVVRPDDRDAVDAALTAFISEHADDGPFGFIAEDEAGTLVGAISITHETTQPSRVNISGRQAYLYGMWVRPESRRQGVARSLVATAVAAVRPTGAGAVTLMASDEGRPVYAGLGFVDVPAMRLTFTLLDDR
jgi:GNAT superfamily N-acetyltransferase